MRRCVNEGEYSLSEDMEAISKGEDKIWLKDKDIARHLETIESAPNRLILEQLIGWDCQSTRELNRLIQNSVALTTLSLKGSLRFEKHYYQIKSILKVLLNRFRGGSNVLHSLHTLDLRDNVLNENLLNLLLQVVVSCPSLTEVLFDKGTFLDNSIVQETISKITEQLRKNCLSYLTKDRLYNQIESLLSDNNHQDTAWLRFLLSLDDGFNSEQLDLAYSEQLFDLELKKIQLDHQQQLLIIQKEKIEGETLSSPMSSETQISLQAYMDAVHADRQDATRKFLNAADRIWENHYIIITKDTPNRTDEINRFMERYEDRVINTEKKVLTHALTKAMGQSVSDYQLLIQSEIKHIAEQKSRWPINKEHLNIYCERIREYIQHRSNTLHGLQIQNQLPSSYKFLRHDEYLEKLMGTVCCTPEQKDRLLGLYYRKYALNQSTNVNNVHLLLEAGASVLSASQDRPSIFQEIVEAKEDSPVRQTVLNCLKQHINALWPNEIAQEMSAEDNLADKMKDCVLYYLEKVMQRAHQPLLWRLVKGVGFHRETRRTEVHDYFSHVTKMHLFESWEALMDCVEAVIKLASQAHRGWRQCSDLHDPMKQIAEQLQNQLHSQSSDAQNRLEEGRTRHQSLSAYYQCMLEYRVQLETSEKLGIMEKKVATREEEIKQLVDEKEVAKKETEKLKKELDNLKAIIAYKETTEEESQGESAALSDTASMGSSFFSPLSHLHTDGARQQQRTDSKPV